MLKEIRVKKAAQHNLKRVDMNLPRNKLIVVTGPSGSGKSSLAFDTLYAEGQRRYIECLSAYARQYIEQMEKPEMESIEGLSPSISIDQRTISSHPRSTVGTVTEVYDFLRLLFARVGIPHCPQCGMRVTENFQRSRLSVEYIKRLLDAAAQKGVKIVSFTGGEPLLFLDDLVILINYAGEAGFKYIRILHGRSNPLELFRKIRRDNEYFRLWLSDLKYSRGLSSY